MDIEKHFQKNNLNLIFFITLMNDHFLKAFGIYSYLYQKSNVCSFLN